MDAARTGSVDRMRRGLTVAMTVCTARGVESPRVHATERGLSAEPSESSPCIPSAGKRENRGEDTRCCESATTMADDRRTPGSCRTSHARSPTVACGPFDKMISKSSQSRDHQRDGSLPVSSSCRKTVGRVRVTSEASTAATRPTSTAGMVPGRALERALSLGGLVATACLTVITLYSAG
jgi:hypothetical protein